MSRKGWLLFISLCVIWGIPYLLIRVAVRDLSPPALVFFRTLPAALLLAPLALHRGELGPAVRRWRWVLPYTIVELAVPWLLLLARRGAAVELDGGAAHRVGPAHRRRPVPGGGLTRPPGRPPTHRPRHRLRRSRRAWSASTWAAATPSPWSRSSSSACCYATGPLIISRRLHDIPSLGVVAVSLVVTAAIYAPPALLRLPASVSVDTVAAVATLAFVCTALAFLLFFALILEVGPSRSTVITYINPLVAVLLGVVLLGEPFTAGIAVGLPLILLGRCSGRRRP